MSTYRDHGQYDLTTLNLVLDVGGLKRKIDLSQAFITIDVYESMFDHGMSGSVSVLDSFDLSNNLPLVGGETIEIEFNTSGNSNSIKFEASVYKISESHRISDHSSGFMIHFVSDVVLKSQQTWIQSSFNQPISQIVESLYGLISSKKSLQTVPTYGVEPYVFGYERPLDAILRLSKRACSTVGDSGYVWFESNRSFHFEPLSKFYRQSPVANYTNKPRGVYDDEKNRVAESFLSIQGFKDLSENSIVDRAGEGYHGAVFTRWDTKLKVMEVYEYSRVDNYSKLRSIAPEPNKKQIDDNYDQKQVFSLCNQPPGRLSDLAKNHQQKIEINLNRYELNIFGNSSLAVGDIISVEIPNHSSVEQDTISDQLITQIHHNISNVSYTQTIMVQSQGYNNV